MGEGITRIHLDDEDRATALAEAIDARGHEVAVVRERFAGEDDDEAVELRDLDEVRYGERRDAGRDGRAHARRRVLDRDALLGREREVVCGPQVRLLAQRQHLSPHQPGDARPALECVRRGCGLRTGITRRADQ